MKGCVVNLQCATNTLLGDIICMNFTGVGITSLLLHKYPGNKEYNYFIRNNYFIALILLLYDFKEKTQLIYSKATFVSNQASC